MLLGEAQCLLKHYYPIHHKNLTAVHLKYSSQGVGGSNEKKTALFKKDYTVGWNLKHGLNLIGDLKV